MVNYVDVLMMIMMMNSYMQNDDDIDGDLMYEK